MLTDNQIPAIFFPSTKWNLYLASILNLEAIWWMQRLQCQQTGFCAIEL